MLGSIVYFFAVYLPVHACRIKVRKLPTRRWLHSIGRELRETKQAFDLTPSAQNQMRFSSCVFRGWRCAACGRVGEARLQGPFANEKEMLFGAARARLQNGQAASALELLQKIRGVDANFRKEAMFLCLARLSRRRVKPPKRVEFMEAVSQFGSVEAYVEYAIWAFKCR